MTRIRLLLTLLLLGAGFSPAGAIWNTSRLDPINARLGGLVVDHTYNHGQDLRIWSAALGQKRDLYVYLPPGFNPSCRYPLLIWLHGLNQDERGFLELILPEVDAAIRCGKFPPVIIAMPDGTLGGKRYVGCYHSAFVNSKAGCFSDYLLRDVYGFVQAHYPIRPERQAHVLGGVSIGGGGAFHNAIKGRPCFGIVFGVHPSLNTRWLGCHGRYFANFDPDHWNWREHYCLGLRPVGRFYGGLVQVPLRCLVHPLYGNGNQVIPQMARDNPIEMLDIYNVRPGELSMLVAYGGRDEFNIDAQVESFLFLAQRRGLCVQVLHDPNGRHDIATGRRFLPAILAWLGPQLAPYSPPLIRPVGLIYP